MQPKLLSASSSKACPARQGSPCAAVFTAKKEGCDYFVEQRRDFRETPPSRRQHFTHQRL